MQPITAKVGGAEDQSPVSQQPFLNHLTTTSTKQSCFIQITWTLCLLLSLPKSLLDIIEYFLCFPNFYLATPCLSCFSFEHSTSPVPTLCEDSSYPYHSLLYLLLPTFLWLRCGFSLPHLTRYCVHACRYCKFEFSVHVTCTFLAKYKIQQLCMWSGVTSNRWTTQGMVWMSWAAVSIQKSTIDFSTNIKLYMYEICDVASGRLAGVKSQLLYTRMLLTLRPMPLHIQGKSWAVYTLVQGSSIGLSNSCTWTPEYISTCSQ